MILASIFRRRTDQNNETGNPNLGWACRRVNVRQALPSRRDRKIRLGRKASLSSETRLTDTRSFQSQRVMRGSLLRLRQGPLRGSSLRRNILFLSASYRFRCADCCVVSRRPNGLNQSLQREINEAGRSHSASKVVESKAAFSGAEENANGRHHG
jgi:hypothetical protein